MVLAPRLIGTARFGEPGRISPTIRFLRYLALASGLFYGVTRSSFLQNRADRLKPIRDKKKSERIERETRENEQKVKDSIHQLEDQLGIKM